MAVKTSLSLTHGSETLSTITDKLLKADSKVKEELNSVRNFFHALAGGDRSAMLTAQIDSGDAVYASATVTVDGGAVDDIVEIVGGASEIEFTAVDARETTDITCGADVAFSLQQKYFLFTDQSGHNKYYVWYNVGLLSTDPRPAGTVAANGIMVVPAENATAATIATLTVTACEDHGLTGVTVTNGASTHVVVTCNQPGVADAAVDGNTGFSFNQTNAGAALASNQYEVGFTDTETAAFIAQALNASADLVWVSTATSNGPVVTITSFYPGPIGNAIEIGADGGNTTSSGTLLGGALPTRISDLKVYHSGV